MFRQINIGLRSALAFGIIGILMLVLGVLSLVQLSGLNAQITQIADHRVPSLSAVENINKEFLRIRLHTLGLIHAVNRDEQQEYRSRLANARQQLDDQKARYDDLARTPEAREMFDRFLGHESSYWETQRQALDLAASGDTWRASVITRDELGPLADQMTAVLRQLNELQQQRIRDTNDETDRTYALSRSAIMGSPQNSEKIVR
ncbi:MCP four helix bundle domain-containing protein [Zobellella taiwanensis]